MRTKGSLTEPRSYVDRYSHPQKLVDLLKENVGKERLEGMLQANNGVAPMVIQTNTLRTTTRELTEKLEAEGVQVTPHGWMRDALILSGTGDLEKLAAFQEGLFYVQDCAAKLSVLCAKIPQNARVLDCCAAPGGKSFAAAMAGAGSITACDIHEHKTALIQKGAERLGISLEVHLQDGGAFHPLWENAFDVVIADVPCSGYGIIRKKPDIRYKDPDSMLELPGLQKKILSNQSRYVKPGGVLLYSTCTLLKRENEDIVKEFLRENPNFSTEPLELPDNFPKNKTGMLTLVPGEYDTDGFFICRLRRTL